MIDSRSVRGRRWLARVGLAAALAVVLAWLAAPHGRSDAPAFAGPASRYEVWTIDQADAARGGAWLYVYDGRGLEAGQPDRPERVNLFTAAAGVGDGPGVRPHMVAFNSTFSHAVIANVASGHVYVIRGADRRIVASIDIGEQAHHAEVSPDGTLIVAANQNGKRLARIRADFASERFTYARADDLNLGAMEDPAHPDNAPICPVLYREKAYVTVRGGGLYLVDYRATPMRVLRTYGREQIGPAGCGGVGLGDKVYINSGSAISSDLYVLDAASDQIIKHLRLSWTGSDGHGLVPTGRGRFLWVGNRADHNIAVINTNRDAVVGLITGLGVAPDIMGVSPAGRHVFVALRGPNNLTGGPTAKGETPGMAILEVTEDGQGGRRVGFAPIGDQTSASQSDPHTLAVRPVR
ncbi:MAG: YncE family protein [Armatimonadota bacterium]